MKERILLLHPGILQQRMQQMRIRTLTVAATVAVAALIAAAPGIAAQTLTNGSLTGTVGTGSVPSGWSLLLNSPDINDATNNVGGAAAFLAVPDPSPDGGTWLGLGAEGTFNEGFGQSISGLVIGELYYLAWYAGNFGADAGPGYSGTNWFEFFLDGGSIGSGAAIALGSSWFGQSLTFTASATSQDLGIYLGGTDRAYLSIDGIEIGLARQDPGDVVPEPATMTLLATGLAGIAASRRKKRRA